MTESGEETVGRATARFGVRGPDGGIVHVRPGDPVPAWMQAVIAPANWEDPGKPAANAAFTVDVASDVFPGAEANIHDIMAWVGDDPARASEAYEAEHDEARPRKRLLAALEAVIDGTS